MKINRPEKLVFLYIIHFFMIMLMIQILLYLPNEN